MVRNCILLSYLVFISFLEISPSFNASNFNARDNESLAFLSMTKNGKFHMNILQYDHFNG